MSEAKTRGLRSFRRPPTAGQAKGAAQDDNLSLLSTEVVESNGELGLDSQRLLGTIVVPSHGQSSAKIGGQLACTAQTTNGSSPAMILKWTYNFPRSK